MRGFGGFSEDLCRAAGEGDAGWGAAWWRGEVGFAGETLYGALTVDYLVCFLGVREGSLRDDRGRGFFHDGCADGLADTV